MLQTSFERGTKDSDVLQTLQLDAAAQRHLREIGGPNTKLAKRYRLHIEIVPNGIPFLPHPPFWKSTSLSFTRTPTFSLEVLDVVDVVVSKLKRFSENDKSDIRSMIELNLISHQVLLHRFQSAVDAFSTDARAEDLPKYVQNLNEVERDLLGMPESEIELPSWI